MTESIRPIRNASDYEAALAEIDALFDAPAGSPEADKVEVLAVLVSEYERAQFGEVRAHPIDVLKMSMKGQGRGQSDLAALLQSRSRASEILGRRRHVSTAMAKTLSRAWSIPSSLLSAPVFGKSRLARVSKYGLMVLILFVVLGAAVTAGVFAYESVGLPGTTEIAATFAGSRTGVQEFTPLNEIPPEAVKAFIAAEDRNFYSHGGYSKRAIVRAAIRDFFSNKRQGGATITQQLAKNVLLIKKPSIGRKIKEILLANRIEQALSKDRILEEYFNRVYFGGDTYGIAQASHRYFGKRPSDLTIAEAAYLAGVLQSPNSYRLDIPDNLSRAKAKRNWVLTRMADDGLISVSAAQFASEEPLVAPGRN